VSTVSTNGCQWHPSASSCNSRTVQEAQGAEACFSRDRLNIHLVIVSRNLDVKHAVHYALLSRALHTDVPEWRLMYIATLSKFALLSVSQGRLTVFSCSQVTSVWPPAKQHGPLCCRPAVSKMARMEAYRSKRKLNTRYGGGIACKVSAADLRCGRRDISLLSACAVSGIDSYRIYHGINILFVYRCLRAAAVCIACTVI
jgi:hypothetical protein